MKDLVLSFEADILPMNEVQNHIDVMHLLRNVSWQRMTVRCWPWFWKWKSVYRVTFTFVPEREEDMQKRLKATQSILGELDGKRLS